MTTKIYRCFVASPSDVNDERNIVDKVLDEINRGIGEIYDFRLESLKWENNVRPKITGEEGQKIINEQIGDEYDVFIGIMFKKFGTPTNNAGSGTEEEFNNAYERFKNTEDVEILFYFKEGSVDLKDIVPSQLEKVNDFKAKMAGLGLYGTFNGTLDFEANLRQHLTKIFIEKNKPNTVNAQKTAEQLIHKESIKRIFSIRLSESLTGFDSQPIIWVEPILSITNEISQNPDDNFNRRVSLEELIIRPQSSIIKAPPQFGLTSLAHHLIKEAWERDDLWIYIDAKNTKPHNIHNSVKNEVTKLQEQIDNVKCIVLDSWNQHEEGASKKVRTLCDNYRNIPIFIMQTIDDSRFLEAEADGDRRLGRDFDVLHLLALPRTQVRKVVTEYNKVKNIGDDNTLLNKILSDLESLNIHRTPYNCLTLLKVSEKYFDESPVNRTRMIEMVLFILFDVSSIPTYKSKPDLKDCEYVLGRFCENMIRNDFYEFSRELFLNNLSQFCKEKLIDLEVEVVFDILKTNNIITNAENNYHFKSNFWIYYFGAKRMHNYQSFRDFIFNSKKYVSFPEIVEFYTGIDRSRQDALEILTRDISETCDIVTAKISLPKDMNIYSLIQWRPTEDEIEKAQQELSENVINSGLPESLKDQHADREYNQIKPYKQNIQKFFEEYSLHNLIQNVKASSRALRNSDYVDPETKRKIFFEIRRSWEQISNVLLALTPVLATNGRADFAGHGFYLAEGFDVPYEEKINRILQVNHTTIVGIFKDDIFSNKLGPLIYDQFLNETNAVKKHQLALLIIFTRPREWKKYIENYIVSVSKNSFFLYDVVNNLRAKYRFDFLTDTEANEISYLIKMGLAKHEFGDKKPGLDKIRKIANTNLPNRENSEN